MTALEIPLISSGQRLSVSLGGVTYQMRVRWNTASECWVVDLYDSLANELVMGIALVTGCDLLEAYGYLDIGGALVAQTDHNTDAVPTFANLGKEGHLYFVTP